MSSQELLRGIFALIFGAILAWGLYRRYDPLMQDEDSLKPYKHWAPILAPCLLPVFLMVLLAEILIIDIEDTLPMFGTMCAGIFIHMSIYFALLIALSPLLRKWISARTCAALWIIPNMLYICDMSFMRRSAPKRIIRLQGDWMRPAVIIWLAGAVILFGWKLIEHMIFRRKIRRDSREEQRPEILDLWEDMQHKAKIRTADIPLRRSKSVSTPLSVGISPRSTFVVLPEEDYSAEEIRLILRHELIHIVRRDAQSKLFLTLCTAFCWFNPLMWIAIRRCSEDLELSCDELVLEDTGEEEKKRYADLILSSAGESKGFTSSLAPKAESLRYRLRQIMAPAKRLNGGLIAGLFLFLVLITSGAIAFAYGGGTVAELAFGGEIPVIGSSTNINPGMRNEYGGVTVYSRNCTDPEALMEYISGLEVCSLSGSYTMDQPGRFLEMFIPGAGGPRLVILEENTLQITNLSRKHAYTRYWYLNESPDWAYIDSLLTGQQIDIAAPEE